MESESNKNFYVETIDKREVNLNRLILEREAFKRFMDYLISRGIKITEVVTDASPSVISTTGSYNVPYLLFLYFVIQKNQSVHILAHQDCLGRESSFTTTSNHCSLVQLMS